LLFASYCQDYFKEKRNKKGDRLLLNKKGDRLLFLMLGSGLILENAIKTRGRKISFPGGKACPHILTEKVACPLFFFFSA